MTRQHIVFLTGAGVSVDSGLSTFRGKDGLWTNEEWAYLARTEALYNDTQRCLDYLTGGVNSFRKWNRMTPTV